MITPNPKQYTDSVKDNVDACAKIIGRPLTDNEQNQVAEVVAKIQRYAREREAA